MVKIITGVLIGAISMFGALYIAGHERRVARKRATQPKQPDTPNSTAPKPEVVVKPSEAEETVRTIITPSTVIEEEDGTKDQ